MPRATLAIAAFTLVGCGDKTVDTAPAEDTAPEEIVLGPYVEVAAASTYTCGLHESGHVRCWGTPLQDVGQTVPPDDVTFTTISAGYYHVCGLTTSGSAVCWGNPLVDYGQTEVSEAIQFNAITVADYTTCGITTAGTVSCWGDDEHGQITNTPLDVDFLTVDAGGNHICGVNSASQGACWGDTGQTGLTDREHEPPDEESGGIPYVYTTVAAGATQFGCGTTNMGQILCWGDDEAGETDINLYYSELDEAAQANFDAQFFSQVDAGPFHTCAMAISGNVHCWGNNDATQTDVPMGYNFIQISVGQYHSCGVTDVGDIVCWGENQLGQNNVPPWDI